MGERRRPSRRRWGRVVAFGVVLATALAASFVAGRFIQPPDRDIAEATQVTIPVDATVEQRVIDSRTALAGRMEAGASVGVRARVLPATPLLTRQTLAPGATFSSGNLVAVIAGEPYFALAGPLPLYRDLRTGDEGDDVTALQRALNTAGADIRETGWVNWATMNAVRELYHAADFAMPSETGPDGGEQTVIRSANLIDAGTASGTVVAAATVGALVGPETDLISIRVTSDYASFRADAVVAAALVVGGTVAVQAGGSTVEATIDHIGEFVDGSDTELPGRDVTLRSADPVFLALAVGSTVTVLVGGSASTSLAVPLTAIRQDNDGDYVLRKGRDRDGEVEYQRVGVSIVSTGGGWAGVSDDELAEGEEVRVR